MTQGQTGIAESLREIWFWSGIFRDHSTFIHDHLAPGQEQPIRWAANFQQSFATIDKETQAIAEMAGIPGPAGSFAITGPPADAAPLVGLQGQELTHFDQQAERLQNTFLETLKSLRAFKQELVQKKLDCTITLALGHGLVQHMINEADEAFRTITWAREGNPLPTSMQALHHHLVWLPDASGHAYALNNGLDGVERPLRLATEDFAEAFDGLHLKAHELYTMLKVAPRMVGALRRLNVDSMTRSAAFRAFLTELREHLEGCEVLGTLEPLLADHMLREELYYTEKITTLGS